MRILLVALIALAFSGALAGCVEEEPGPDLIGVCPYWEPGTAMQVEFTGTTNVTPPFEMDGLKLDRYWVTIDALEGDLELRAFDQNGTQRPIQAAGGSIPVLRGGDELIGDTVQIPMAAPNHEAANPSNLTLTANVPVAMTVTPLYKVCGL